MQADRIFATVAPDGMLHIPTEHKSGTQVELILMASDGQKADEYLSLTAAQAQSGFVQNVLARSEEDVWNAL